MGWYPITVKSMDIIHNKLILNQTLEVNGHGSR
jgi:hypothetical protein